MEITRVGEPRLEARIASRSRGIFILKCEARRSCTSWFYYSHNLSSVPLPATAVAARVMHAARVFHVALCVFSPK